MKFADVVEIRNGRNQRQVACESGKYPIYGSGGVMGYASDYICEAETIVLGRKGSINHPIFVEEPFWNVDTAFGLAANRKFILPKYLYYFCVNFDFEKLNTTVTIPSLTKANLLQIEITVPDKAVQEEVIRVLDKVQSLIELRKREIQRLDELVRSRFIEMFGEPDENPMGWEVTELEHHLEIVGGFAFKSTGFTDSGIPVLRIGNINSGHFLPVNMVFWPNDPTLARYKMYPGDLVMSLTGTVGKDDYGNVCILSDEYPEYYLNQRNAKLVIKATMNKNYLSELLKFSKIKKRLTGISRGVRQANISNRDILALCVPTPPIKLQEQFAAFVEQSDKSKLVREYYDLKRN